MTIYPALLIGNYIHTKWSTKSGWSMEAEARWRLEARWSATLQTTTGTSPKGAVYPSLGRKPQVRGHRSIER